MCNKVVDNYPHTLEFVPDCYIAQECMIKLSILTFSTIKFVPEYYKTQEMREKDFN